MNQMRKGKGLGGTGRLAVRDRPAAALAEGKAPARAGELARTGVHKSIVHGCSALALALVLVLVPAVGPAPAADSGAPEGKEPPSVQTQLQVLQALNQIAVSLNHIITYNDKVVLDQEYSTIINNLNLSRIPDAEIIALLQELMDLLTSSKIQDRDRAYLAQNYDKNVQNELKKRMRARIFESDLLLNPYTSILNAVLNVGSFYFNYRYRMEDYKKERDEAAWKIEAATLQGLNNFYKKLLKASWELMRRYQLPDEWRLDEKQLNDYLTILKETNLEVRYRKLERLENSFQKFPPYWYYRGQAAQEINNKAEALRSFNRFQEIHQGILRRDPYAASTAMSKTMLLADSAAPDEIRKDLKVLLANSEDADWGNILFAALQYARLGDADTAGRLILRNLDNGHLAFIEDPEMIRVVGPALLLNARPDVFHRIMDTILNNDQIKNYDVLWLYGRVRNRDILKRIQAEFDHVLLLPENRSLLNPVNVFKADNLSLYLPTRWIADNLAVTLHLREGAEERRVKPAAMAALPNFPEITAVEFKNVLSIKNAIKKKETAQVRVALVREKLAQDRAAKETYDIELLFTARTLTAAQRQEKIDRYARFLLAEPRADRDAAADRRAVSGSEPGTRKSKKAQEEPDDNALWFGKESILLNGERFTWTDEGVLFD